MELHIVALLTNINGRAEHKKYKFTLQSFRITCMTLWKVVNFALLSFMLCDD